MAQQVKPRRFLEVGSAAVAAQTKMQGTVNYNKDTSFWGHRVKSTAVNYTVNATLDGGAYLIANNVQQPIFFNLPAVNACNGYAFSFICGNAGVMQIVGDTNAIVNDFGISQKAINFGLKHEGAWCDIIGDGTKYFTRTVAFTNALIDDLGLYVQG